MTPQTRIIAGGIVAVLGFEVIGSYASRALAFPYARVSVGTYFIYLIVGFLCARAATESRAKQGAVAAGILGLVKASAGWAIAWSIGPGRPPSGAITPDEWIATAAIVALFAFGIGFFGGAVGARSNPHVTRGG